MDEITIRIIEARAEYTEAQRALKDAQEDAQLTEAALYLATDYKSLGSNETERKRQFDALARADEHCERAAVALRTAEQRKTRAADALATAEDARRAYENALRAAYLEKAYGVKVNPADFTFNFNF